MFPSQPERSAVAWAGQAERGDTTLSAANIAKVAELFEVIPDAFAERSEPDLEMQPQFRHLRRAPAREQRKAERFVLATALAAGILRDLVDFPEPFSFACPVNPELPIAEAAEQVERAAALTRIELGLLENKPISYNLISRLEAGGITVVRDSETDRNIDAHSAAVGRLPVIVLDGGEVSVWDRDNFNLAHELGHLVMHRGIPHTPGTRPVEAQAHRFAGAFPAPAEALRATPTLCRRSSTTSAASAASGSRSGDPACVGLESGIVVTVLGAWSSGPADRKGSSSARGTPRRAPARTCGCGDARGARPCRGGRGRLRAPKRRCCGGGARPRGPLRGCAGAGGGGGRRR